MATPCVSLSYAQALRAMKRERCDLTPFDGGWSPNHRKWSVSDKHVKRMIENGEAEYADFRELADGGQYAFRLKLESANQ